MEFVDVVTENPLDKLPSMHDTQHAIESELKEVIYQINKKAYESENIAHSCTRHTPAVHLPVISIFTIKRKEEWKKEL